MESDIPDDWSTIELGKVADVLSGFAFKSNQFAEHGIAVIKIKNIVSPYVSLNDVQYVSEEIAKDHGKYLLKYDDMLISMTGSNITQIASVVGKVGRYKYNSPALLNQRVGKIFVFDTHKYNSDFLFYVISRNEVKYALASQAGGSANQANISPKQIKSLLIPCPTILEQKKIAALLCSLDDKIELNTAINKNLEEMAQALFKRWFIDFEFPNENGEPYKSSGGEFEESELGAIPKGWKVSNLDEVLAINPRRSLSKNVLATYVDMKSVPSNYARVSNLVKREYTSGSRFINGDVLLARITPCLENGKTAYVDFLEKDQTGWGSTEFIVLRSKEDSPPIFAYFLSRSDGFRSHAIASMTGSSGRQRVPEASLRAYKFPIPSDKRLINSFGEVAQHSLDIMKKNDDESLILAQIRDTLLPKLMSGEIRVPLDEQELVTSG